ncbi:methyltransferase domain-containing protein [Aureliella helgolandensis]|uniref:Methyltransferase domain protein n=1 Tax=Aureliella helgolandensis TaxID=2527968 RepID=A0A518GFJ9_9BACT|nr:class I SAM-dependent methyltransferase [Aureliella helgolandensis]QDV27348.1 hypothetical protein Q31a_57360 [Aureliella helgolandensis]
MQPRELLRLWDEAESIWSQRQDDDAFHGYVSADFEAIHHSLRKLRKRTHTFLEWGSGLGVVAIMASRLGFDAYGIEVEPELVALADELAERFAATPTFAVGSFIPDDFDEQLANGDEFHKTVVTDRDAYGELDMELRDFDLVYAYPWPEEHGVFRNIVRTCGAKHTLLLRYDAREGLTLSRPAKNRPEASR